MFSSGLKTVGKLSGYALLALIIVGAAFLGGVKYLVYKSAEQTAKHISAVEIGAEFPLGVNPKTKEIIEDPIVDWYVRQHLSINADRSRPARFFERFLATLAQYGWYQQLATPNSRILVIYPGERREEVVKNFADILGWSEKEREEFASLITLSDPALSDGKFYPGRYVVERKSPPQVVADLVLNQFHHKIVSRYSADISAVVPLQDALTIASLLEREAYDFTDMRIISGIIWNRLFIDMPLQLDASLQYVRGSRVNEPKWWPAVRPSDKFIESPYNTYQEKGLPPAPIANPAVEAVVAALNPKSTDCLFYFHDSSGNFYCTETYEEHVNKLNEVYKLTP